MALVIATIVIVRNIKHILILAVILASVYFIPDNVIENRTIKVALVQGGVVNLGLNFNNKPKEVFMRHLNQTSTSISPSAVDLIIWPENAVDVDVFRNDDIRIQIEKLSQDLDTPILVGAVTRSSQGLNNQAILFDPKISQTYSKRYLTPFGEYLPLRSFAESVSKYATRIDDFYPGNEFITFNVNGVKFNSLICYELINDIFTKENVNDFVVIQTNNATFGDTAQLDQQLNIARVRAIESGRGVAYVSTTGITSFIDTNGKVTSSLEKFEPGTLIKEITTISGQTNAQKIGFLVESISLGFLVMILGYRRWKMDV
jgi:apolipoprotein N-acyltransferase